VDYEAAFEAFKLNLFYPDYELDWVLRTDASSVGVGAILFQVAFQDDGRIHQPIGFTSKKSSEVAQRWFTYDQEACAVFFGVEYFDYYLRGKEFVVETDHQNLKWIENSNVPRVVRWRMFLLTGVRFQNPQHPRQGKSDCRLAVKAS
jgi:hypothetical protein